MEEKGVLVTQLLSAAGSGDREAEERLFALVYGELRSIANAACSGKGDRLARPTSLVHDAYTRLLDQAQKGYHDRGHFFAVASRAMRQLVTDRARRRGSLKRGGDWQRVTIDAAVDSAEKAGIDLLELNDELEALAEVDPRLAQIVELRFYAGLAVDDCGPVLGVSRTVAYELWRTARAMLRQAMSEAGLDR